MKLLLIEDNPGDVRLIRECFEDNPYPEKFEVIDFSTLSQGIQYLSQPDITVDAIMLDLGLPDSMGLETLRKIQSHSNGTPIIVLTGAEDNELVLRAVKEGAQDYLIKGHLSGHLLSKSVLYAVERKTIEELKYKTKIVEEANRKKSDFLAMMSHEIKNPLGLIIGFSDLLLSPQSESKQKEYIKYIHSNAMHLNELINDLLDLSRIESGRIKLEKSLFNLEQELEETCGSLKNQAAMKDLELSLVTEESVPAHIWTDRTRFRQVIYNLVGNAIKFTENGSISIHVKIGSHDRSIDILIKDTGCGIEQNDRPNLFQAFSQANKSVYRKFKGTGLGLTLSKQIAKSLGGDLILLDSTPGQGSTFLFHLEIGA